MSGKVKLSITALCLSALALYHASSSGDTSLMRLIYTALGLGLLVVSFVTAAFKKKLWIVAAAVAVAALYGRFISMNFHKIDMKEVIPEDAAVDYIDIGGEINGEPFDCFWKPSEGEPVVTTIYDRHMQITGGGFDLEKFKEAVFYSHLIPNAAEHFSSWADRIDVCVKRPDSRRVDVAIYDDYDFDGCWNLYVDGYDSGNPYSPSNDKRYSVLTTADLSGMIPDSVAELILSGEKNVAIPADAGVNKAEKTEWTEDYSGNAELSTQMERTGEGELLLNCSVHSRWTGEETPDKMTVTAEVYVLFEGASEPVLLDSVTKEGEGVKTRFFNVPQSNILEASPNGGEPIWVEVRQKTVFTFGDKEQTVNNAVRYER